MNKTELKKLTAGGKDSRLQFKKDIRNEDSLAAEMVAFSNKVDASPVDLIIASGKTSGKILSALKQDANLTIPELSLLIGVTERSIERNIKKLQKGGHLRRIGPAKGGRWEIQ